MNMVLLHKIHISYMQNTGTKNSLSLLLILNTAVVTEITSLLLMFGEICPSSKVKLK